MSYSRMSPPRKGLPTAARQHSAQRGEQQTGAADANAASAASVAGPTAEDLGERREIVR
jgi:hypothetical protein